MSFVFYDTETTGTNTTFDQILQFGAIRTDAELKELDRFEIRCRLLPSVVPSPGAMRVTGITADQLTDPNLPTHYQMVCAIKEKLEQWSPAVFIGHNSVGFDEHLLRQAFFQNLHPPYLTNTNGNCRSDSLRILQAIALYEPGAFVVPQTDNGKRTFKLDHLAPANGFDHSAAHDAMGDVEAMIHMCRILAERSDIHWSNFIRFAQKAAVTDFILEEEVISLTDFFFGKTYSWMVTAIGPNPEIGSQMLSYNLAVDPDELLRLNDDELSSRLTDRPKPVRAIRTNACPCVLSYEEASDALRAQAPDLAVLTARAKRIHGEPGFADRLIKAFLNSREEKEPSPYIEEQIYNGFSGPDDQTLMTQFHQIDWPQRPQLLTQFDDPRLQPLGERLIFFESPDLIAGDRRAAIELEIAQRLMANEGTVPWLTYPKAIADTDDLLASAKDHELSLLRDLRTYLVGKADLAGSLIA